MMPTREKVEFIEPMPAEEALPRRRNKIPVDCETVAERLYWSYAILAMAQAAIEDGHLVYDRRDFMIRSRLYSGLLKGTLNIGGIALDERLKISLPQACCYCGSREHLAVDHLVPTKRGGQDSGDNMVWACRPCNSSKGARDVIEWLLSRGDVPPLLLLRRYLKLAIEHCSEDNLMDCMVLEVVNIPFALHALPGKLTLSPALVLWKQPTASSHR
jgi:hypothetical protein